jgi:hypothetical protein
MRCRKETGLKDQAEFFYPATAKEKNRAAKLEVLVLEHNNDIKKMSKIYTELIGKSSRSGSFNRFFKYIKKDSNAKVL